MWRFQTVHSLLLLAAMATAHAAAPAVRFDAQSARSGKWSDARTWVNKRAPRSGDNVRISAGHLVTYDANWQFNLAFDYDELDWHPIL